MTKYNHFMLDIETLGTKPDAAIVQIGITGFQPTGGIVSTPKTWNTIPHEDASFDYSTVAWWIGQSEEARKSVFTGDRLAMKEGLQQLTTYIEENASEYGYSVWSKPSTFDLVILESTYRQCNMVPPWKHWETRCLRTLIQAVNLTREDEVKPKVAHDAGSDSEAQAWTAIKCHNKQINKA